MAIAKNNYRINSVEEIDSPALLVFPEIVRQNLSNAMAITQNTDDNSLRPHVKTVKCKEPIEISMSLGVHKYKCSTISEAEMLGNVAAKDVLLSYQLSKPKALRFKKLRKKYPDTAFSSLIDNFQSAQLLSEVFKNSPATVYLDINVGMDRTGIKPTHALQLLEQVIRLPSLKILGFHCYEGHISSTDPIIRKKMAEDTFSLINDLKVRAEQKINTTLNLVIGGSPTFSFYTNKPNVDCSPGTIFLWDSGYGNMYNELPFKPASIMLTRIISIINDRKLCLDLGYKAIASDPPLPRVVFLDIPNYDVVGQYEEHMIVEVQDTSKYKVGDSWLAIPIHICPTVNLYKELIPIINGEQQKPWKVIARDRKITI